MIREEESLFLDWGFPLRLGRLRLSGHKKERSCSIFPNQEGLAVYTFHKSRYILTRL